MALSWVFTAPITTAMKRSGGININSCHGTAIAVPKPMADHPSGVPWSLPRHCRASALYGRGSSM